MNYFSKSIFFNVGENISGITSKGSKYVNAEKCAGSIRKLQIFIRTLNIISVRKKHPKYN